MRIENTIEIDAPIERLWDLTLDVESWPDHSPTMTSIERLDDQPLAVGSAVRIKQPAQRARVWTVTELESGRRFAWSARTMGTTMTATHAITPNGAGTIQTLSVDLDAPGQGGVDRSRHWPRVHLRRDGRASSTFVRGPVSGATVRA